MNTTLTTEEVKALSRNELEDAFFYHCKCMGSGLYYYDDELEYASKDPAGVVVFREGRTGKLRAYHKRER